MLENLWPHVSFWPWTQIPGKNHDGVGSDHRQRVHCSQTFIFECVVADGKGSSTCSLNTPTAVMEQMHTSNYKSRQDSDLQLHMHMAEHTSYLVRLCALRILPIDFNGSRIRTGGNFFSKTFFSWKMPICQNWNWLWNNVGFNKPPDSKHSGFLVLNKISFRNLR